MNEKPIKHKYEKLSSAFSTVGKILGFISYTWGFLIIVGMLGIGEYDSYIGVSIFNAVGSAVKNALLHGVLKFVINLVAALIIPFLIFVVGALLMSAGEKYHDKFLKIKKEQCVNKG